MHIKRGCPDTTSNGGMKRGRLRVCLACQYCPEVGLHIIALLNIFWFIWSTTARHSAFSLFCGMANHTRPPKRQD